MSGVAVMPAILLVAAATGPAFEAPASAVASSAAIAATVGAPAPAAALPATAAAERPLETGAGIAAYARGLAREFAERFRRLARNTRACFTGK
jgi:hypothetical protein